MKEVWQLKAQRFGELTKTLVSQAHRLGFEDDIFEGYRHWLNEASHGRKNGEAHKILVRVTYEIYDALRVFQGRIGFFKDPAIQVREDDGSGSFKFRSLRSLDQTVITLQHLFHQLLKDLLDFHLYRADSTITKIEEYLLDQADTLHKNMRKAQRAA